MLYWSRHAVCLPVRYVVDEASGGLRIVFVYFTTPIRISITRSFCNVYVISRSVAVLSSKMAHRTACHLRNVPGKEVNTYGAGSKHRFTPLSIKYQTWPLTLKVSKLGACIR